MRRIGRSRAAVWLPVVGGIALGLASCVDFGGNVNPPAADDAAVGLDDGLGLDTSLGSDSAQGDDGASSDETDEGGDDGATTDEGGHDGASAVDAAGLDAGVAESEESNETGAGMNDATAPSGGPEAGPEAGRPDAGTTDAGGPDTSVPDTGAADTGAPDTGAHTGAPDTGAPDTGALDAGHADGAAADGSVDAGVHGCDPTDPGATTLTCVTSRNKPVDPQAPGMHCLECAQAGSCFDPSMGGGTCEILSGSLTHFSGALLDGKTCTAVLGTEPVSEKTICMQTLQMLFSSKCSVSGQETPCLCGTADPTMCLTGTQTPNGPLYDEYACDFNSTNGSTISADFLPPTAGGTPPGAAMADAIVQCVAGFGCDCF